MLRRNWVAQCKFGSGSFTTDAFGTRAD